MKKECKHHGLVDFVLEGRGYYRCKRCRNDRVIKQRQKNKATLVFEAGGKCILCGYDHYIGALQFHHRDPKEKKRGLSQRGLTLGIDKLREEAQKCDLLCSNCHAEVEGGLHSNVEQLAVQHPVKVNVVGSSPTVGAKVNRKVQGSSP